MKTRTAIGILLVSIIGFVQQSLAVTEAWSVVLTTSRELAGAWQVVSDGSGGCACKYLVQGTNSVYTATFLWLNAQGNQIYRRTYDDSDPYYSDRSWIATVSKNSLVYSLRKFPSSHSFIVVDRTGRETALENCDLSGFGVAPTTGDKRGFFAVRYRGDSDGTVELVRFLYK